MVELYSVSTESNVCDFYMLFRAAVYKMLIIIIIIMTRSSGRAI